MSRKLKPCPFCSNQDIKLAEGTRLDGRKIVYAYCDCCGCIGASYTSKKDAQAAWNDRGEIVNNALKPCPFCQSNNIHIRHVVDANEGRVFYAYCNDCSVSVGKFSTREAAQEAWNRRVEQ